MKAKYTFLIISPSVLLRVSNISEKTIVEKIKTLLCKIIFFPKIVPFMGKNRKIL
jgi:hypothetical protein